MIQLLLACLAFFPALQAPMDETIEALAEKAESRNPDDRIDAVLKAGAMIPKLKDELQLEAAYELLISKVGDRSDLVRSSAKMRIAELGTRVLPYLRPFVESKDFNQFADACESIKAIGPKARIWIPALAKHIDSKDDKFRLAALHALGVMNGEDLLPYLDQTITCLDSDNFNIQLSACRVLSRMGPAAKKAGPRLVKLLEKGIASSRSWASIALGAIGTHEDYDVVALLTERLDRFYLIDRERALIGLAHLGPAAKSALPKIEALMNDRSKSVQHVAARTYWKITGETEAAVKTLVELLPTMEFGTDAMDILGEIGVNAEGAVPALIKQLQSPEAPSRESAVYALASLGAVSQSALPELEKLMEKDRDQLIRAAAKLAIDRIKADQNQAGKKPTDEKK